MNFSFQVIVAVSALPLFLSAAWYLMANAQQMERPRRVLLALSACGLGWMGHATASKLAEHVDASRPATLAVLFGILTIICLTTNTLSISRSLREKSHSHQPR